MIIADTSGLLALFNRAEPSHALVVEAVEKEPDPLVVSPFVVAELDYLAATRVGVEVELQILVELSGGAYLLPSLEVSDLEEAIRVVDRYRDQEVGLADASVVVLAERYSTRRILTLDRRHFQVLRPLTGGRFSLIP